MYNHVYIYIWIQILKLLLLQSQGGNARSPQGRPPSGGPSWSSPDRPDSARSGPGSGNGTPTNTSRSPSSASYRPPSPHSNGNVMKRGGTNYKIPGGSSSPSSPSFHSNMGGNLPYSDLDAQLNSNPIMDRIINIVRKCAAQTSCRRLVALIEKETKDLIGADRVHVFLVHRDQIRHYSKNYNLGTGLTGHCYKSRQVLQLRQIDNDPRYDEIVDMPLTSDSDKPYTTGSALITPIEADSSPSCTEGTDVVAIVQCYRLLSNNDSKKGNDFEHFHNNDITILKRLFGFLGNMLRHSRNVDRALAQFHTSLTSHKRSNALLDVAKSLASETKLDAVVSIIVAKVPELLDADRCTLFFTDQIKKELVVTKGASKGKSKTLISWIFGQCNAPELPFPEGCDEIRFPMGKGIAGHVADTGEKLNIVDAHYDPRFNSRMDKETGYRTRSILCLPMIDSENKIIGVVQAINKNPLYPAGFDQGDETLLNTFCAQAALAVRNANLFEKTQKALKQSDALLEVTTALSQELNLGQLVKIICAKVQELLSAERCTVFIVDKEKSELYTNANMTHGMGAALPIDKEKTTMIHFPMNRGIAGSVATTVRSNKPGMRMPMHCFWVWTDIRAVVLHFYCILFVLFFVMCFRTPLSLLRVSLNYTFARQGKIVRIIDAYEDPRFNRKFDQKTGFRTKAILCVPIKNNKSEVCGVLQMINKKSTKYTQFTDEDERMVMAFSAQAAVAIENNLLFQQTEKALNHALADQRNLKFMLSVTKNLFSDMHLTSMIDQMTMQVHHLLKADDCALYLVDDKKKEFYLAKDESDPNTRRYPFSTGIVGVVARTGNTIRISTEAHKDPRFHPAVDQRYGKVTHSILACPIKAELPDQRTSIIGVISVRDEKDRGGFESEEEKLLKVFCAQAAVAIMNSKRFSSIMDQSELKNRDHSAANYLKDTRGMKLASDDIDVFHFKMEDIHLKGAIGTGSYGEVYRAVVRGKVVAVKKLHVRNLKAEQVDAFCKEASLMCQLDHPNVVGFIGAVTEPSNLCIITQYCARGSLADLLLEDTIPMTMERKLECCVGAAEGMLYLHKSNPVILHRDLKSDNLLVDRDWNVKVADFGLTRFISEKKAMTQVGTPMWMAPEIIMGKKYTEKADVYAFGIILWEILTRLEPYEDKEPMQIVVEVVNEDLRPTIPDDFMSSPLIPLMKDCWHKDPEQRPSFKVINNRLADIVANLKPTASK